MSRVWLPPPPTSPLDLFRLRRRRQKHLRGLGGPESYQSATRNAQHTPACGQMNGPRHNGAKLNQWCQIEKIKRRKEQNALPFTSLTSRGEDGWTNKDFFVCLRDAFRVGPVKKQNKWWLDVLPGQFRFMQARRHRNCSAGRPFMVNELIIGSLVLLLAFTTSYARRTTQCQIGE